MWGANVEVDGIYYNIYPGDKTAKVVQGESKYTGDIVIPESFNYENTTYYVSSIGKSAFTDCNYLFSISLPTYIKSIEDRAFMNCESLSSIELPASITSLGEEVFYGCKALTSVELPASITTISYRTFMNCSSLASITIPTSVTSIGKDAFMSCVALSSIKLPASITTIEERAFYECNALTSVEFPSSVTSIGYRAFASCEKLESIKIPASVTIMGNEAFAFCDVLKTVYNYAIEPQSLEDAFRWVPLDAATLHVINGSKAAYEAATEWSDFGTIVEDLFTEGIEEPTSDSQEPRAKSQKILRDGVLLIERNGKTYNAQGAVVD